MKFTVLQDELNLLRLVSEGDEQAFRKIFDFYSGKLYSFVYRISGNEEVAEEIVMDGFMKVWANRTALSTINRFDAYLYTLVRNQAFNSLKRVAHEQSIIDEMSFTNTEYQDFTEQAVIYKDYQDLLDQTVNQLPPQQRQVYRLNKEQGLKYDEIANQLNLSPNTVKAHLKKAVSNVRTVFANYLAMAFVVICGLNG